MEKIALESLRLIAADYVSQQVINEFRTEGIYCYLPEKTI